MPDVGSVFRDVEIKGVQNFGVFVEILPGLQVCRCLSLISLCLYMCDILLGTITVDTRPLPVPTRHTQTLPKHRKQGLVHVSELATKRVVSVDALYKVRAEVLFNAFRSTSCIVLTV